MMIQVKRCLVAVSLPVALFAMLVLIGVIPLGGEQPPDAVGLQRSEVRDGVSMPTHGAPRESPRQPVRDYDDIMADVARAVPEFGGLFVQGDYYLVIYLLDMDKKAEAEAAVAEVLPELDQVFVEVRFVEAQFAFADLYEWRMALRRTALGLEGVTMLDLDERENRIAIGVKGPEDQPAVESLLDELGIPREAVYIDVVGPFCIHTDPPRCYD